MNLNDNKYDNIECSDVSDSFNSDAAFLKSLDDAYEESLEKGFYSYEEMMELLRDLGANV